MPRPTKQTITAHISRMEAANSIGNIYEWELFKKAVEEMQIDLKNSNKEINRLRSAIKSKNDTMRPLKYKLRVKNETTIRK